MIEFNILKVCDKYWNEDDERLDIWEREIKHQFIINTINNPEINITENNIVEENYKICMKLKLSEIFKNKLQNKIYIN